jgi:glucose-1-phosphate cytidylyltransferase
MADPPTALAARLAGVDAAVHRVFGDELPSGNPPKAAAVLRDAFGACDVSGRPLFAANRELDWPDAPHLALWHAATLLREHRGDGHVIALAAAGFDQTFCATYADGVADLDLRDLLRFHRDHGALASMTVVRPRLPFGITELNGDAIVTGFHEKPHSEHWINGGFFCLEPRVLERLDVSSVLEREPLESLAADGELRAYRHEGFWDCMDTYKDAVLLNDLWESGEAPWRTWA